MSRALRTGTCAAAAAGRRPGGLDARPGDRRCPRGLIRDGVWGDADAGPESAPRRRPHPRDGLRLLRRASAPWTPLDRGLPGARGLRGAAPGARARPRGTIREVTDAKLLGRGGAAFPTGVKWKAVAEQPVRPHYFVCNADESEPGTFKDRVVMEQDPFAVIEALTIAGITTGCERGYVYIRGEYPLATERLATRSRKRAPARLPRRRRDGHGAAFDIELRRGAGAYICGEETALFNSLEGKRGEPRNKPPFPVQRGAVRQAHRHQQRRDADQRARGAADRRPGVRRASAPRARPARGCSACPVDVERPGVYEHDARRHARRGDRRRRAAS